MSKNCADETPVCCCIDVGSIIDNTDCTASYSRLFASRVEADEMLAALTAKAREVESEPCHIVPRYSEEAEGLRLEVDFIFSCQAETMIFQLALR